MSLAPVAANNKTNNNNAGNNNTSNKDLGGPLDDNPDKL